MSCKSKRNLIKHGGTPKTILDEIKPQWEETEWDTKNGGYISTGEILEVSNKTNQIFPQL